MLDVYDLKQVHNYFYSRVWSSSNKNVERHLLFRHLENNHNEFECLPIENKIHKAIQTVVVELFLYVLFCFSFVFVTQLQKLRIFKIHFDLLCSFNIYTYVQEKCFCFSQ